MLQLVVHVFRSLGPFSSGVCINVIFSNYAPLNPVSATFVAVTGFVTNSRKELQPRRAKSRNLKKGFNITPVLHTGDEIFVWLMLSHTELFRFAAESDTVLGHSHTCLLERVGTGKMCMC